jgi:hypothetical protein
VYVPPAAGAELTHPLPFEVNTLPDVPGEDSPVPPRLAARVASDDITPDASLMMTCEAVPEANLLRVIPAEAEMSALTMVPSAILPEVIALSATLAVVIALSETCVVPTALVAMLVLDDGPVTDPSSVTATPSGIIGFAIVFVLLMKKPC